MTYRRRSIRLPHYDYSRAGYYFITVTTHKRMHLFGEIDDGVMVLNVAGEMIRRLWYEIEEDFPCVALHDFVIMPNHMHGIIQIVGAPLVGAHDMYTMLKTTNTKRATVKTANVRRATTRVAPTVGDVVGAYKSKTTNTYIQMVKNNTLPPFDKRIWQRNYYEHVVRDANDHTCIAEYIQNNPLTWEEDMLNAKTAIKQIS